MSCIALRIAARSTIAGNAGEVLVQHARRREVDLAVRLVRRDPAGDRGDVVVVTRAQHVLEQDPQRVRKTLDALDGVEAEDLVRLGADVELGRGSGHDPDSIRAMAAVRSVTRVPRRRRNGLRARHWPGCRCGRSRGSCRSPRLQTKPSAVPPHGPAMMEPRFAVSLAKPFDATISLVFTAPPKSRMYWPIECDETVSPPDWVAIVPSGLTSAHLTFDAPLGPAGPAGPVAPAGPAGPWAPVAPRGSWPALKSTARSERFLTSRVVTLFGASLTAA